MYEQEIDFVTRVLGALAGDVRTATDSKIVIFQDDATYSWIVQVGSRKEYGRSLNEAITKQFIRLKE